MFLKLSQNIEKTLPLRRVYKGQVVDNEDPEKLGRVKCTVTDIFEGAPADLPWVFPLRTGGLGGTSDSGSYSVPEVGAYLEIRFPTEDVYSPFYYGYWEDANTHIADFDTDYPNTYGFRDKNGTKLIVNKAQGTFEFTHESGIEISMTKDGDMSFTIPKTLTAAITDAMEITSDADVTLSSQANVTVEGQGGVEVSSAGTTEVKGDGGTTVGASSSSTQVNGSAITLAGGGPPIARLGDQVVGLTAIGIPVSGNIVVGSTKVTSA